MWSDKEASKDLLGHTVHVRLLKNVNRIVISALAVLCAAIVFLAIRNDVHFNKERKEEVRHKDSLDLTARTQTDCLMLILNNVTDQLDSIRYVQYEHYDMIKRDIDSIKISLEYITRIEKQRLNIKK